MASIILKGIITTDGHLEVELPPDVEPGQVEIEIRRPELRGITGSEILQSDFVGMWADRTDIDDSVEFARELRRQVVEGVTLGQLLESGLVGIWADRTDIEDSVEFARELRRKAFRRWTE